MAISSKTRVDVDPDGLEGAPHGLGIAEVAALVVAEGEERLVGVEEQLGLLVADHDAGLEGEEPGLVLGVVPDVRLALGHVGLAEGEGHEGHVPRGAGPERLDHVFMGVPRERAAVVPGDGEGAAVGVGGGHGHVGANAPARLGIPSPIGYGTQSWLASRPSATPRTAPPSTSEAWWMRT